jgi:hypothetical protein
LVLIQGTNNAGTPQARLAVVDVNSTRAQLVGPLLAVGEPIGSASWSADGTWLFFCGLSGPMYAQQFGPAGAVGSPIALPGDREIKELLAARHAPLQMIFAPEPPIDPLGEPDAALALMDDLVEVGATGFSVRFRHHSRSHYVEQMAALQELSKSM